MAKINPEAASLIEAYILKREDFAREICEVLYELILKSSESIQQDWKWSTPMFQKNGMVCGFAAFKKHVTLHFMHGALMSDKHKLFTDDCSAQHSRSIKFYTLEDVDRKKVFEYLQEAFVVQPVRDHSKPKQRKEIVVPELLQNALNQNELAKQNFEKMAYTYRKEYAHHISDAKREATKLKRLEKVIHNLERNIKMHEQYKC